MRTFLAGLAALVLLLTPVAASAQDPGRAELEDALIEMFSTENVIIMNVHGDEDTPEHWYMIREISGAKVTSNCFMELATPTILDHSPNVTPAPHYRIAWAGLDDLDVEGEVVYFHAAHMAENELGGMLFESEELAEMVWAVFHFMVEDCS
ncbi:MAG: hypothetical protein Q8S53_11520 [Brevundimonas sp.]|uniref:hypothetical protein n=1 Tax=Brevundimonas sp. TaxID=1871086 RepID=UPI0027362E54|nr:hypothetical protein [Brevundimonas sp.]MDP3378985.1 hypothetical protein [Brevundimonas sp.]